MIHGCAQCGGTGAKRVNCMCPGLRLCERCTDTHRCPSLQNVDVKTWRAQNAPEHRLQTQVIAALNILGIGVHVWGVDSGGARQRNRPSPEPGAPDVQGYAKPDGRFVGVETKCNHKDACVCESCVAQRAFGAHVVAAGGVYVSNARTVQQAIDGVRMGLARARARLDPTGTT